MMFTSAHSASQPLKAVPCAQHHAIVTSTGIADAGNDHGRVATTQSLKECFISFVFGISRQRYTKVFRNSKKSVQKCSPVPKPMTSATLRSPFYSKVRSAASICRMRLRLGEWGE